MKKPVDIQLPNLLGQRTKRLKRPGARQRKEGNGKYGEPSERLVYTQEPGYLLVTEGGLTTASF